MSTETGPHLYSNLLFFCSLLSSHYSASALHHAAFRGQASVTSFLINSGIKPDAPNDIGLSPLHYAAIGLAACGA
jgi:ankyrin repeat protein